MRICFMQTVFIEEVTTVIALFLLATSKERIRETKNREKESDGEQILTRSEAISVSFKN
jgi:hypothetical protein